VVLDATCGAAGHARELARRVGPGGTVLGIDRDPTALEKSAATLETVGVAYRLFQGDFTQVPEVLEKEGLRGVNCLLFDLGLSSDQLADGTRGFSFALDGPLDMRYDPTSDDATAADLIARLGERELADIFWRYGEERFSRRIAARIAAARRRAPIRTTAQLAGIVKSCAKRGRQRIHPATRVFQALRIAVNRELELLEEAAERFPQWLLPEGRAAFISFHSLEDRIVKRAMKKHASQGMIEILTKKVIKATEEEISRNPRARGAKLRAAVRRNPQ